MNFKKLKNLARGLGFVLVFLVVLEGAARITRHYSPGWFKRELGSRERSLMPGQFFYWMPAKLSTLWGMLPGTFDDHGIKIRINSLGMRGPELSYPKQSKSCRIMFLGDSSVFGYGIEEEKTFPFRVARLLAQAKDRTYEVANAAVPAYSSTQCRIVLEDILEQVNPDIVVLAPLWSDMMSMPWDDAELLRKFSSSASRFKISLLSTLRKSALISFLETRIESLRPMTEDRRLVISAIFGNDQSSPGNKKIRVSASDHLFNISKMVSICQKQGIEVCLLILPGIQDQEGGETEPGPPPKFLAKYRNNYRAVSREFHAVLVDMPRIFRDYPLDRFPELFIDGLHPTDQGHEIIAENLTRAITTRRQTEMAK